jgi:WD40 repeat protein
MEGYPFKIRRVAFDGSGRYLANDGAPEVSVWDFGGPGPEGRAPVLLVSDAGDEADAIGCFAWNPSEALLAVGWESGLCHTYVVQDGVPAKQKRPNSLVSESDASVACLAWAPDATGLCIADASGAVTMLEVEPAS